MPLTRERESAKQRRSASSLWGEGSCEKPVEESSATGGPMESQAQQAPVVASKTANSSG